MSELLLIIEFLLDKITFNDVLLKTLFPGSLFLYRTVICFLSAKTLWYPEPTLLILADPAEGVPS